MKWYWKCMFGGACILGVWSDSVKCTFAQAAVEGAVDSSTFSAVDPVNAVIAIGVMLVIGIFAYMKRHKKDR